MPIAPSDFLYIPVDEKGNWTKDSQGKIRLYKSATAAFRNLQDREYTAIHIYAADDILSREEFEKAVQRNDDI